MQCTEMDRSFGGVFMDYRQIDLNTQHMEQQDLPGLIRPVWFVQGIPLLSSLAIRSELPVFGSKQHM